MWAPRGRSLSPGSLIIWNTASVFMELHAQTSAHPGPTRHTWKTTHDHHPPVPSSFRLERMKFKAHHTWNCIKRSCFHWVCHKLFIRFVFKCFRHSIIVFLTSQTPLNLLSIDQSPWKFVFIVRNRVALIKLVKGCLLSPLFV